MATSVRAAFLLLVYTSSVYGYPKQRFRGTGYSDSAWTKADCSFEASDLCSWTQGQDDTMDWNIMQGWDVTGDTYWSTYPSVDHTLATSDGWYVAAESPSTVAGRPHARLQSPVVPVGSSAEKCLTFYYHMTEDYPADMGFEPRNFLNVYLLSDGELKGPIWTMGELLFGYWNQAELSFTTFKDFQVVLEAVLESENRGDIAIDDIKLRDRPCAGCNHILTDRTGTFTSPRHPNPYPQNTDCTWTIKAPDDRRIRLAFDLFDILQAENCEVDYITVSGSENGDGIRHCGSIAPDVYTSRASELKLQVKFRTTWESGYTGFSARYAIVPDFRKGSLIIGSSDEPLRMVSVSFPGPFFSTVPKLKAKVNKVKGATERFSVFVDELTPGKFVAAVRRSDRDEGWRTNPTLTWVAETDRVSDVCTETEFRCADLTCIPGEWRCDGEPDCPDSSDESPDECRCPFGYGRFGDSCFKVSRLPADYAGAEEECLNDGAHLAAVKDQATHEYILSQVSPVKNLWVLWIGLEDRENEGSYVFADGTALSDGSWQNFYEQSLAEEDEDCVEMYVSSEREVAFWNDQYCTMPRRFVCQTAADPPTTDGEVITPPAPEISDEDDFPAAASIQDPDKPDGGTMAPGIADLLSEILPAGLFPGRTEDSRQATTVAPVVEDEEPAVTPTQADPVVAEDEDMETSETVTSQTDRIAVTAEPVEETGTNIQGTPEEPEDSEAKDTKRTEDELEGESTQMPSVVDAIDEEFEESVEEEKAATEDSDKELVAEDKEKDEELDEEDQEAKATELPSVEEDGRKVEEDDRVLEETGTDISEVGDVIEEILDEDAGTETTEGPTRSELLEEVDEETGTETTDEADVIDEVLGEDGEEAGTEMTEVADDIDELVQTTEQPEEDMDEGDPEADERMAGEKAEETERESVDTEDTEEKEDSAKASGEVQEERDMAEQDEVKEQEEVQEEVVDAKDTQEEKEPMEEQERPEESEEAEEETNVIAEVVQPIEEEDESAEVRPVARLHTEVDPDGLQTAEDNYGTDMTPLSEDDKDKEMESKVESTEPSVVEDVVDMEEESKEPEDMEGEEATEDGDNEEKEEVTEDVVGEKEGDEETEDEAGEKEGEEVAEEVAVETEEEPTEAVDKEKEEVVTEKVDEGTEEVPEELDEVKTEEEEVTEDVDEEKEEEKIPEGPDEEITEEPVEAEEGETDDAEKEEEVTIDMEEEEVTTGVAPVDYVTIDQEAPAEPEVTERPDAELDPDTGDDEDPEETTTEVVPAVEATVDDAENETAEEAEPTVLPDEPAEADEKPEEEEEETEPEESETEDQAEDEKRQEAQEEETNQLAPQELRRLGTDPDPNDVEEKGEPIVVFDPSSVEEIVESEETVEQDLGCTIIVEDEFRDCYKRYQLQAFKIRRSGQLSSKAFCLAHYDLYKCYTTALEGCIENGFTVFRITLEREAKRILNRCAPAGEGALP